MESNIYAAFDVYPECEEERLFDLLADCIPKARKTTSKRLELPLKHPLVWIDLEMTGLDVERDEILQIACIITDGSLQHRVEGEEITIHHSEDVLAQMNTWSTKNHGDSGLTDLVRNSTISVSEAESRTLEFIKKYVPEPGIALIAGNSVHVDISFLKKHMPSIVEYCHYRIIDVSTVGELCRRWYTNKYNKGPRKSNRHTAMSDIRESIQQLEFYKRAIFKPSNK